MGTAVATDALFNLANINPNVNFTEKVRLVLVAS